MKLTPENLRICRTGLDITQGELARRLGVSSSFLSAIERNERRLTKAFEMKLLDALQTTEDDLIAFVEAYQKLNGKGECRNDNE